MGSYIQWGMALEMFSSSSISLLHFWEYPGNPALYSFRDKNSALQVFPSHFCFWKLFLWLNCFCLLEVHTTVSWMMLEKQAFTLTSTEVATNKGLKGNREKFVFTIWLSKWDMGFGGFKVLVFQLYKPMSAGYPIYLLNENLILCDDFFFYFFFLEKAYR